MFYCWECVSIVLKMRTIDFVIKDYSEMFAFLRILLTYMMHFQQIEDLKKKISELSTS